MKRTAVLLLLLLAGCIGRDWARTWCIDNCNIAKRRDSGDTFSSADYIVCIDACNNACAKTATKASP